MKDLNSLAPPPSGGCAPTQERGCLCILLLIALTACSDATNAPKAPAPLRSPALRDGARTEEGCPGEASSAVLRKLVTEFGHYDSIQTVDQVSAYEYKLECVREWSKTIQDGCIRNGYADWLEFYAGRAREARADILANKRQSERDDYERKRREEERLLRAYEAKHSVPSPPLCERSLIERVK